MHLRIPSFTLARILSFTLATISVTSLARADEEPLAAPPTVSAFTPRTGFTVEGRLRLGDGALILGSGTSAPFFVGWRGDRLALLVGPMFDHYDNPASNGSSSTSAGANVRGELTLLRLLDRHLDAYLPVEGTVGGYFQDDVHSVEWSVSAGIGARYWIHPGFGVFLEGGLGVQDVPLLSFGSGIDGASTATSIGRSVHASISSSLGLAYTF